MIKKYCMALIFAVLAVPTLGKDINNNNKKEYQQKLTSKDITNIVMPLLLTDTLFDISDSSPTSPLSIAGTMKNVFVGLASWYGPGFHGKKTASGEEYNMHELTAAHKTLPFGTKLKVTNVDNGKTIVVRINDRGPYIKGRILDLSFAAAKQLGYTGVAKLKIERL